MIRNHGHAKRKEFDISKNERKYQRSASPWVALYYIGIAIGSGIPAMLAMDVGICRITDDQTVTVDGSAGTVELK